MLKVKILLLSLIICQLSFSQSQTISGYVEDSNTGERIIGAYVIDSLSRSIAQTNNYGFYNLKIAGKKAFIKATYIGFKSEVIFLSHVRDTVLNIKMKPVMELKEVVVTSSRYNHTVNGPLGMITIPVKQLTSMPALGEADLIKSIQSQPGIKGGVEGSAGIFVRGGGSGENLFMLDDVPIYNVSHLYGFFSTFNSNAIKDIKILKGCFPSQYGGRVSSVIDVRSRDGNNKSLTGEMSVGIISANITLEGPILNDKTTFIVSGRSSYFNLYSAAIKNLSLLNSDFPDYNFYDINARLSHTFSQKDKIFLSFYNGKDNIKNKNNAIESDNNSYVLSDNYHENSGWGNLIGSLRWNHTFGNSLFANTTIAYSRYKYFTQDKYHTIYSDSLTTDYDARYKSEISDYIVKTDFDYTITNNHKIMFGAGNTFHTFEPGRNDYRVDDQKLNVKTDTSFTNSTLHASEAFIYVEDEIKPIQKLSVNSGLRLSGLISGEKTRFNLEPRISANYILLPQLVIKAGYSRMVQYMHLLSTSGLTMPTDIWVPALKGLNPLKSDQINAGIAYNWANKILVSIEVYRKWLYNTTDYKYGSSLLTDLSPWYEKTTQGNGNAKGIELSVEKQEGRLTGSINYTLSRSDRKYDDLNNGLPFPFIYDRLHDFNISVNYQISQKWDVSAFWIYGTGYPVTLPVEKYASNLDIAPLTYIQYYSSINNCRLPAYHRLDLGIHYKTHNHLGDQTISFDVFNAYDRKNPVSTYYYYSTFKYSYLLPIIPSVTYTLKFK
jgi:outer membrane cobalamin receptor